MEKLMKANEPLLKVEAQKAQKKIREQISKWFQRNKNEPSWLEDQTIQKTCVDEYLDSQEANIMTAAETDLELLNFYILSPGQQQFLQELLNELQKSHVRCNALKKLIMKQPTATEAETDLALLNYYISNPGQEQFLQELLNELKQNHVRCNALKQLIKNIMTEAGTDLPLLNYYISNLGEQQFLQELLNELQQNHIRCNFTAYPKQVTNILEESQELSAQESDNIFETFCNGIENTVWAGDVSAFAFSKIYNVRVQIFQKDRLDYDLIDSDRVSSKFCGNVKHTKTVYFLFNGSDHYDALIPLGFDANAPAPANPQTPAPAVTKPIEPEPASAPTPAPPVTKPPEPPVTEPPKPEPANHASVTDDKHKSRLTIEEKVESRRKKLIYQAFIDLFCSIFKAKQKYNCQVIGALADATHEEHIDRYDTWKEVLDWTLTFWNER